MNRIYVGDKPVKAVMIDGKKYVARVGREGVENILYQLPTPVVFTGDISDIIDTGLNFWEEDVSFIIEFELTLQSKQGASEQYVFSCQNTNGPYNGIKWGYHPNYGYLFVCVGASSYTTVPMQNLPRSYEGSCKVRITHMQNTNKYVINYTISDGSYAETLVTQPFKTQSNPLILGGDHQNNSSFSRLWTGLVKSFKIIGGNPSMTETKKLTINKIDSEDTFEKLVTKGSIGDDDISFVEGDFVVAPSADAKTGDAADAKSVWDMIGDVKSLIDAI